MVTSAQCLKTYGPAAGKNEGSYMTTWNVPADIQSAFAHVKFSATGTVGFPTRIYCNKLLAPRLEAALRRLMTLGLTKQLKTWDGCYMVRHQRGYSVPSLHSWGVAVDVNAAENALGKTPVLSKDFVGAFTQAGFDWGGAWTRPDGMHFQLKSL